MRPTRREESYSYCEYYQVHLNRNMTRIRVIIPMINADATVKSIDLGCDFKIASMPGKEFAAMMYGFDTFFAEPLRYQLYDEANYGQSERPVFFAEMVRRAEYEDFEGLTLLRKKFDIEIEIAGQAAIAVRRILLFRLAAEGELLIPFEIWVRENEQGDRELLKAGYTGIGWRTSPVLSLTADDSARYKRIAAHENNLTNRGYLDIAFGLFGESYNLHHMYGFIMLVSALEAVLGERGNLTNKLSWRSAAILGDKTDGPRSIRERVRALYKLRCDVLHGNLDDMGRSYSVRHEEMIEMRGIVRRVIVRALDLNLERKILLKMLDDSKD